MFERKNCEEPDCGYDMPVSSQHCPHCGRPRRFPNVDLAQMPRETEALQRRYDAAMSDAADRGANASIDRFATAVGQAKPVIAYPFAEVHRLARSDNELAQTFYSKGMINLQKGSHVLQGSRWDSIRAPSRRAKIALPI